MTEPWGKEKVSGGLFMEVESGSSYSIVFIGDPLKFRKDYVNGKYVSTFNGLEDGDRNRFKINVGLLVNGSIICQILEAPISVFNDVVDTMQAGYDPHKHWYLLSKSGTGKKTRWKIQTVKDGDLQPGQLEMVSQLERHPLKGDDEGDDSFDPEDDVPQ